MSHPIADDPYQCQLVSLDYDKIPPGEKCMDCEEPFDKGQKVASLMHGGGKGARRVYLHHECMMRNSTGGINHILGQCSCDGGNKPCDPDVPELSRRKNARLAYYAWTLIHQN